MADMKQKMLLKILPHADGFAHDNRQMAVHAHARDRCERATLSLRAMNLRATTKKGETMTEPARKTAKLIVMKTSIMRPSLFDISTTLGYWAE